MFALIRLSFYVFILRKILISILKALIKELKKIVLLGYAKLCYANDN